MYLVEQGPGREVLYQSTEELASAIRRGEVNSQSRIYHRTTSTWISITLHPAYRKLASRASDDAASANTLYPPLPMKQWTFLPLDTQQTPGGTGRPGTLQPDVSESASEPARSGVSVSRRWRLRFWR
jgi:hypothetical protein